MRSSIALLISSAALSLAANCSAQDETRPRFSIKQGEALAGSNIKRNIVEGSVIPHDKSYGDLSPEHKLLLKSQYEQMGPDDEPPYPLNGTKAISQAIAAVQQRLMVEGELALAVQVNDKGEAISVSVLRQGDPQMIKHAAAILMLEKYNPAVCGGTPCAMPYPFRVTLKRAL